MSQQETRRFYYVLYSLFFFSLYYVSSTQAVKREMTPIMLKQKRMDETLESQEFPKKLGYY